LHKIDNYKSTIENRKLKWARQDSNLGPRDYESPALTAELQAHVVHTLKHIISMCGAKPISCHLNRPKNSMSRQS
jgi:hypothetical protein